MKTRQGEIDATPAVQGSAEPVLGEAAKHPPADRQARLRRLRREMIAAGRDYLAWSNARKLGTCDHRQGYRRGDLDEAVLALLRDRLMQPDAVAEFVSAFSSA